MGREDFTVQETTHTPHHHPTWFMYLLNSGAETLFVVPGVPKQLGLPSNTSDSKTIKLAMDGKMQPPSGVGGMGGRKRQNRTLDLNSASPKKNKVQNLLTSPDVQMLKLTSPELEKFLSQNPSLATPTPSSYGFPKSVTEEQMMYAKGFEEALEKIKYQENYGPTTDTVTAANSRIISQLFIFLYLCPTPPSPSPHYHQIIRSPDQSPGLPALMTQTPTSFQRALWPSR